MASMVKRKNTERNFFYKISEFIVQKRMLFTLLFTILFVFCCFTMSWVKVSYDITQFLPDKTETKKSLSIMEDEFYTYGTAKIMISNVTLAEASKIKQDLIDLNIKGVKNIEFDDDADHYKNSNALFVITLYDEDGTDGASFAVKELKTYLQDYTVNVQSATNNAEYAEELSDTITITLAIVAVIIAAILLWSSKSYFEVIIFATVFIVAAVLNMGTNFLLGEISFVSNTVAVILQLALSIDYAIIFAHRFIEEREKADVEKAVTTALSKAIPEISASCLTTIAGLIALMFMQLRLGMDLGSVLVKSVACSIITVFILMPALLVFLAKPIEKTRHKNFVPSIKGLGKIVIKTKYVIPVVFVVIFVLSAVLSSHTPFVYTTNNISAITPYQNVVEQKKIESAFGVNNTIAVLIPSGDYIKERQLLKEIEELKEVKSATGLANIEFESGYYITDKLTIKKFSELMGINRTTTQAIYIAYAIANGEYNAVNIDTYGISLINLLDFVHEQIQNEVVQLDDASESEFLATYNELQDGRIQLQGKNWSRLVLTVDLPTEGQTTYEFIDEVRAITAKYYDGGLVVGDSTSAYDFYQSFSSDNILLTILTAVFVLVILLMSFKNITLPVLLIAIIEGAIFINFAIPTIFASNVYFFTYLTISAIQMGATIDYAIVLTSRFEELKKTMPVKEAITESLDKVFPTVITSGSIMTVCGFFVGFMINDPIVSTIGLFLGIGTLISMICVMFVLPQFLLLFYKIVDKTNFKIDLDQIIGSSQAKSSKNKAAGSDSANVSEKSEEPIEKEIT